MKTIILFTLLWVSTNFAFSQVSPDLFKALYINNFCKNLYPENTNEKIDVVIYGNSAIIYHLKKISQHKYSSSSISLNIIKCKTGELVPDCKLIFIPENEINKLENICKQLGTKKTIIVTEFRGALKLGADINFVEINDRLNFEINNKAIKEKYPLLNNYLNGLHL